MTGDRHRELIERFLDRVAQDPTFREKLRTSPQEALEEAGFAQQMRELQPRMWEPSEVTGYAACLDTCFNQWTCLSNSCYLTI